MMRHDIVAAARSWIGTPYRHQASLKGVGCDCLGLLRGVWRDLLGEEPEAVPAYSKDWAEAGGRESLLEAAGRHLVPRASLPLAGRVDPANPIPAFASRVGVGDAELYPERPPPRFARPARLGPPRRGEGEAGAFEPGDILLFRWRDGLPVKHCGIATSGQAMVHAHDGASVAEVAVAPWWDRRIAAIFSFPGTEP